MNPLPPRIVVSTADPVFGLLCKALLDAGTVLTCLALVAPTELLGAARQHDPDLILLDLDGQDIAEMTSLASKLALVTQASLVFVSACLGPGSAALGALLQSVAGSALQKPQGVASLSLASADGAAFLAALQRAAGHGAAHA